MVLAEHRFILLGAQPIRQQFHIGEQVCGIIVGDAQRRHANAFVLGSRSICCPKCSAYAEPGLRQPWSDWSATVLCGKGRARWKSSIAPSSSKGPASAIGSSRSIGVRSISPQSDTRRSAARERVAEAVLVQATQLPNVESTLSCR